MSTLFKQYRTNAESETNGVPVDVGFNEDGSPIRFIVGRNGKNNMAYRKAFEKAAAPHRKAMQKGTVNEEVAEAMLMDLFCAHLLRGWSGVRADAASAPEFGVEDGELIPFNPTNAKKLMQMLPDLYEELSQASADMSLFTDEQREEEAKNL